MKRFEIGQIVVALTNPPDEFNQPRTKGCKYPILDVMYCSKCGIQDINIAGELGKYAPNGKLWSKYMTCSCGNTSLNHGKHWTNSENFALVDDIKEELEEAVANEDYELAALLRDINN